MKGDYLSYEGEVLANMRLLIEGAANLFENDAQLLCRLAIDGNQPEASVTLDTIGTALYGLRQHIRAFQEAYAKEGIRQAQV